MKDKPLAAPNVEQATPSGTIHAKSLKTLAPNVVATALGLQNYIAHTKKFALPRGKQFTGCHNSEIRNVHQ